MVQTAPVGPRLVEYLRGLLLIQQGANTRLLNATAEQAADMEALAARMPAEWLLRAIRLFNDAVTEVKSGLQAIPQLPLEMALVEAILGPASQVSGSPAPPPPTAAAPVPPPVSADDRQLEARPVAEQLIRDIGLRPVYLGDLDAALAVELA